MRIIHTSDWHLGLDLGDYSRLEEQKLFLDWLISYCVTNEVDALLVAGDIYDVANPSVDSQRAFTQFLVELYSKCPKIDIVVIGGNHDSAYRLEIPRPFGKALGAINIVGNLSYKSDDLLEKGIIEIKDSKGQVAAQVLGVPFMRVHDLDCKLLEGESLHKAYDRSLNEFYKNLINEAKSKNPELPLIGMGHFTMIGGSMSGSEQPFVGGIEAVSPETFESDLSYMAMGHIHRPQKIKGEFIRYSGSPISMDFDERNYKHQIVQIDFEENKPTPKISEIEVPQNIDFKVIPQKVGSWEDLEKEFNEVDWSKYKELDKSLWPFVQLQVKHSSSLIELRQKTKDLIKDVPMRLIGSVRVIREDRLVEKTNSSSSTTLKNHIELSSKEAPQKLLEMTWSKEYEEEIPTDIMKCFQEVLSEVRQEGSAS